MDSNTASSAFQKAFVVMYDEYIDLYDDFPETPTFPLVLTQHYEAWKFMASEEHKNLPKLKGRI